MIHVVAFSCCFAGCLIYALRYGGGPERAGMLLQVAAAVLTLIAIRFVPQLASFNGLASALAVVDVGLLIGLVLLALKANRLWTIILAGLQLSMVLVHLSKAVFPALPEASYGIFAQFWAWPMLFTTALGTLHHRRRVADYGMDQDWKPLWPHSPHRSSTA